MTSPWCQHRYSLNWLINKFTIKTAYSSSLQWRELYCLHILLLFKHFCVQIATGLHQRRGILQIQVADLVLNVRHKILLLLFEGFSILSNGSKSWNCPFLYLEIEATAPKSPWWLGPLIRFCLCAMRTDVLKRFFVFWLLWHLWINSSQNQLHLEIVSKILNLKSQS